MSFSARHRSCAPPGAATTGLRPLYCGDSWLGARRALTKYSASNVVQSPPPGFEPYPAISSFMMLMGQLYARKESDGGITVGLWVQPQHLNHQDAVHGGMVASLADNAMACHAANALGGSVATVHLAVDYLARVSIDDWLEVRSRLDRQGKKLLFAACTGMTRNELAFRASAVFSAIGR